MTLNYSYIGPFFTFWLSVLAISFVLFVILPRFTSRPKQKKGKK